MLYVLKSNTIFIYKCVYIHIYIYKYVYIHIYCLYIFSNVAYAAPRSSHPPSVAQSSVTRRRLLPRVAKIPEPPCTRWRDFEPHLFEWRASSRLQIEVGRLSGGGMLSQVFKAQRPRPNFQIDMRRTKSPPNS